MRRLRFALWPAGLALGLVAEWVGQPELIVLDAAAGFALLFLGLVAWSRRPASRVGPITAAAGFAWFLGTLWAPAVFLHRGPLANLLLSYPSGRLSSRLDRGAIGAAYAYAAVYPAAGNDYATIAFALGLVALSTRQYLVAGGPERRARLASLLAALAFGLVLILGASARFAEVGNGRAVLFAYDLVVGLIAAGLFADLLWGGWVRSAVTGLVVDLGDPATTGTLRDRLARALADPKLVVGYWLPEQGGYVDEAGRPVESPSPGLQRAVTSIEEDGRNIAVLVHDAAVLDDRGLIEAVASATRLAVSNARLQAQVRTQVAEVEASRRRIIEAADAQRRRLEQELRDGAEQRLERVQYLVSDFDPELRRQLQAARAEIREFAHGIHPASLTSGGLAIALAELAARSPVPVEVSADAERYPPAVEAAVYFFCSEALANVAKHAGARRVHIRVSHTDGRLIIQIGDDGVGGADLSKGSGLRRLADRLDVLGGELHLDSPSGLGTRLVAHVPLDDLP